MKIASSYGKEEVENKSRRILIASLIIQSILLIIVTILVVSFASANQDEAVEKQLNLVEISAEDGLINENYYVNLFPECKIIYYYSDGRHMNDAGHFSKTYDESLNEKKITINKVTYKVRTGSIENPGTGPSNFMIYRDMTKEREDFVTIVWLAVLFFVVTFVVLALLTYWIIQWQIKHYEHAVALNNQLVSDISHEFNTPLAIIKASLAKTMSEPDVLVEEASESLVTVTNEADRLSRMVRDMLILSRSDSDRLIVEPQNCNVSKIVEEVIEPFAMMCELQNKKIDIQIAENVESRVDPDKLKQAVIILLDNAIKYTSEGDEIAVILKDGYLRYSITVADTGIGVKQEDLQHVFERFYRTDASRNLETGGSGLGLSIVKAIANALKGKVLAFQNKPKGFKVVLDFPKEKFTQILQ